MPRAALACAFLLALTGFALQDQVKKSPPELPPLPPPTDIDPQLTQELRQLEQQLGEAAMHMDTKVVERLVGPEYTLRMGDAPEQSVPRALWMESLRPQSGTQRLATSVTVPDRRCLADSDCSARDW